MTDMKDVLTVKFFTVGQQIAEFFCQGLSLYSIGSPIQAFLGQPRGDVPCRCGGINAKLHTEAGLLGSAASESYDGSGLSASLIDGVDGIHKEYFIQNPDLAKEIEAWEAKNGEVASGVYQSESFGGYTYTKATDAATGGAMSWQSVFRSRLSAWRKI